MEKQTFPLCFKEDKSSHNVLPWKYFNKLAASASSETKEMPCSCRIQDLHLPVAPYWPQEDTDKKCQEGLTGLCLGRGCLWPPFEDKTSSHGCCVSYK